MVDGEGLGQCKCGAESLFAEPATLRIIMASAVRNTGLMVNSARVLCSI